MEGSLLNQESVDNLQQMSKDMKHHIAQLKAELANDDFGSQKLNTNEVMDESYCFETLEANVVDHMKFKADLRSKENLLQDMKLPPLNNSSQTEITGNNSSEEFTNIPKKSPKNNVESSKYDFKEDFHPSENQECNLNFDEIEMQTSLSLPNDLSSSNIFSNSFFYPCVDMDEESIPVKYLQMSSNSSKAGKKVPIETKKSLSTPSSGRKNKSLFSDIDSQQLLSSQPLKDLHKLHCEQLEKKFLKLQANCEQLARENIKMKKDERSIAIEKITTLKKSNAELANIAKKLEIKAKAFQEQNVKKGHELSGLVRELQQQKRSHQRQRVRWDAERQRLLAQTNDQLNSAKSQVDDLKRALRQVKREKFWDVDDETQHVQNEILRQNQLEMIRLQKLAAAASSKVVVRSLSTPFTARHKVLEDSNRTMRKQNTLLGNKLEEIEMKLSSSHDMEQRAIEENKMFKEKIDHLEAKVALLKSELEQAKVETSDTSVKLLELKHVHGQVQEEYAIVHQQLAIAIQERDLAAKKCFDENAKLKNMQSAISDLESNEASMRVLHKKIEEASSAKIQELIATQEKLSKEYASTVDELKIQISQLQEDKFKSDKEKKLLEDKLELLKKGSNVSASPAEEIRDESEMQMFGFPKGKLHVAKYSYNPYQGPNEHPVCELSLKVGDYVHVLGDIDKDGFYQGQLTTGQKGLVPSNFIEAIDEISTSFHHSSDFAISQSSDLELLVGNVAMTSSNPSLTSCAWVAFNQLKLEWNPPSLDETDSILGYEVLRNGRVETMVKDSNHVYLEADEQIRFSISVCSLTRQGRSDPGHCTFTHHISSDSPCISELQCEHITTNSVRLRWLPLDSALIYKISIGESEKFVGGSHVYQRQILVTRPLYRHTIEGLRKDYNYEVIVKTNYPGYEKEISSLPLRFSTLSFDPPDPPTNFQIKDKKSNVFLSWHPVTVNDAELSNRVSVLGYKLFVANRHLITVHHSHECQCEIEKEKFAKLVAEVVKENQGCHPVMVVVRTMGVEEILSDMATFYLSEDFVTSLLISAEYLSLDTSENVFKLTKKTCQKDDVTILNSSSITINHMTSPTIEQIHIENQSNIKACGKTKKISFSKSLSEPYLATGDIRRRKCSSSSSSSSDHSQSSSQESISSNKVISRKSREKSEQLSNSSTFAKVKDGMIEHKVAFANAEVANAHAKITDLEDASVSLYVALFDYNPTMMSPNSDCYEDELPFSEGQLIKVYGNKDDDGFLMGEDQLGRKGLVPGNMVAQAEVDLSMLQELFTRGFLSTASPRSIASTANDGKEEPKSYLRGVGVDSQVVVDGLPRAIEGHQKKLYRALYDYDPREASPNIDSEIELSFCRGDVLAIFGPVDEDGFFRGELRGQYGLIPSNFVQRVYEEETSSNLRHTSSSPFMSSSSNISDKLKENQIPVITSSSISSASNRSDKAKKRGVLSKGKKFLKKIGSSEKPRR